MKKIIKWLLTMVGRLKTTGNRLLSKYKSAKTNDFMLLSRYKSAKTNDFMLLSMYKSTKTNDFMLLYPDKRSRTTFFVLRPQNSDTFFPSRAPPEGALKTKKEVWATGTARLRNS